MIIRFLGTIALLTKSMKMSGMIGNIELRRGARIELRSNCTTEVQFEWRVTEPLMWSDMPSKDDVMELVFGGQSRMEALDQFDSPYCLSLASRMFH